MITINLLDWRSKRVKILNHRFGAITAIVVILASLLALSVKIVIDLMIDSVKNEIVYLDTQLHSVEDKILEIKGLQDSKQLLLSRRKVIEDLQQSRPLVVKIFDNIARVMPDDITLTEMVRKGDDLSLSGNSYSNSSIANLVDKIQQLDWVQDTKIGEIRMIDIKSSASSNEPSQFTFQIHVAIKTQNSGAKNATS